MATEIKMPELGDGIESGDVLEVLVKEGDVIQKEQSIVEVETDKATVEIPSSHAGKVVKIHVAEGDTVKIGGKLISVEAESAAGDEKPSDESEPPETEAAPAAPAKPKKEKQAKKPAKAAEPAPAEEDEEQDEEEASEGEQDEAREDEATDRGRLDEAAAAEQEAKESPAVPDKELMPPGFPTRSEMAATHPPAAKAPDPAHEVEDDGGEAIAAGPAVRRFAREVGVDLSRVKGSGAGGRITRDDVLAVVRKAAKGAGTAAPAAGDASTDDWGPVHIERLSKIRQTIAAKMSQSWSTATRVTNFDEADVTDLERIRQSSKADYAAKGIKLTSMPFVVKAVAMALKDHPLLNASIDTEKQQVILKDYVNIGIAVDTDRGLLVPSLRDADKLAIPEIARRLASIAESVRQGSFKIEDLRGSTFTISNLGAIGGTYSTPIINVPEVAILLLGRARKMPVVVENDQIAIRLMMPLSLSYDHRLVDGAAAARFLNEVIGFLKAPSRLLLAP